MKTALIGSLATLAMAESNCYLTLFTEDFEAWDTLGTGFIAGFYKTPPESRTSCGECREFGL